MEQHLIDQFEDDRTRLLSVGYRLTGSFADAEDAVQEAWLRLDAANADEIRDLLGWLTTVISRICLDRLKSATKRRESYVGQWLPEPLVTAYDSTDDPLDVVVRDEDTRLAAMVVLDTMSPDQRVSFVLHDGFGVPFDEIASILSIEPATARQHASRARKAAADVPPPVADSVHDEAVGRFLAAMAAGDLDAVLAALHPDALMIGDANGTTRTAANVILGADKFARFYLGLFKRYGPAVATTMLPVRVNGQLGVATRGWTGDDERTSSPARIAGFTVRDGLVCATYDMANPEKFRGIRLEGWPTHPPRAPGTHRRS